MKILVLSVLLTSVLAAPVLGFRPVVGIYSDVGGSNCHLRDDTVGVVSYYVVITKWPSLAATQFTAPMPSCMQGAQWVSDEHPFDVTIGDSQTGVAIGFGFCLVSPLHVLTINYLVSGSTPNCCCYRILPHPEVGRVEVVDCMSLLPGDTSPGIINPSESCVNCLFCNTVATAPTTWGHVKAFYGEAAGNWTE